MDVEHSNTNYTKFVLSHKHKLWLKSQKLEEIEPSYSVCSAVDLTTIPFAQILLYDVV
jgi:hypothetical protein